MLSHGSLLVFFYETAPRSSPPPHERTDLRLNTHAREQLKIMCHFSVKQKSGRKRKPREGDAASAAGAAASASNMRGGNASGRGGGGGGNSVDSRRANSSAALAAATAAAAAASAAAAAATVWGNGDMDTSGNGR